MMEEYKILKFEDIFEESKGSIHLLAGNGFSIACDPIFHYDSIYKKAVESGLSERAQIIFEGLGTNNFEGVMHLLDHSNWVAQVYGLLTAKTSELLRDNELIKTALVTVVGQSHPDHTGKISELKKASALRFLKRFKNIFCTNYDLLQYWVNMSAGENPPFKDGFRADSEDDHLLFSGSVKGQSGLFYLHGALHLYVASTGETLKRCWIRSQKPLTTLIRDGLKKQEYPLFVAEGSATKKLEQIRHNPYLNYCFNKFGRVENNLVVFGHSLGDSDAHIRQAIAENTKFHTVYIGLYGDPNNSENQKIKSAGFQIESIRNEINKHLKKEAPLTIRFFDSFSANVWE